MTTPDHSGTHATLADSGDNSTSQALPRGSNLGRYVIIEPIGSGGMGTVYRAYDPQLNRGIALKILSVKHADQQVAERAKARLIREAQALAQLSHPNVVAVHDAGTFEDDVFIAMELVEGKTLGEWMREKKRSVKEILGVTIAAGRGLSAAHKAGLVHRDFKPGNVIVGDDGRVRVLDFGLARAADQQEPNEEGPEVGLSQEPEKTLDYKEISSDSSPNLLQSPLTHAGGVLGTPLYMAPEQHLGLKTDERTDQFGFCVVLYEALYGRRPFAGRSLEKLKSEVIRQQVCVPRADSEVPAWLWQIIRKGLSAKPEDRYPTLDSLLVDLKRDPEEARRQKLSVRRRKLSLVSLVLLVVTLPIGVWYGLRYRTFQLCKDAEGEFDGIWDTATKTSIRKSFLSIEKSFARASWQRVELITDGYLSEWHQMQSDICEAKLLRATLSEELFDMQMSCLRKRKRELKALMGVFVRADEQVVQKAVQASSSLSGIALCSNEEALRAPYPPPKTEEERVKIASIRERMAEVEALSRTGKYREGMELAKNLEREAKAVNYPPVISEVLYWYGFSLEKSGEYQKAETTLQVAVNTAGEIRDALLAAKGLVALAWVVGYRQALLRDGLLLGRSAQVMLDVAGGDEKTKATLLNSLGSIYLRTGDYNNALEHYSKSMEIFENVLGPENPKVAMSLNNLGVTSVESGEFDRALFYYRKALAIREKVLGPEHPDVAMTLNNMGALFWRKGDNNKAIEYLKKALSIKEKALGPTHPNVAYSLDCIAELYHHQGEYDRSQNIYRRSLTIMEKSLEPDNPMLAWPLAGIGVVFISQGEPRLAFKPLERAVKICQQKECATEPHGQALFGLARALLITGQNKKRAVEMARKARDLLEQTPKKSKKELKEVNAWLQKHGS